MTGIGCLAPVNLAGCNLQSYTTRGCLPQASGRACVGSTHTGRDRSLRESAEQR